MKRKIIIASHNHLASGMKSTLEFITGPQANVECLDAYVDDKPIDQTVEKLIKQEDPDTEIVIFTDLMAGSVNQKFYPYRLRPHTHLITGMNLPLVLALAIENTDTYLTSERINHLINAGKEGMVYVNEFSTDDEEDE